MTTPGDGQQTVGRYRILGFLGAGAMGEVYLAEDPQIERKLAIKTVKLVGRPSEVDDRKKRLLREARAVGRLLHPNIVTLFDVGEADGQLFLAFELVEGTDLAARMEAGPPLSLREVLRIVRQVAEALDFAHRQGIVHRDIKPSNILLDKMNRVKVADFGIAKVTGQSTELTVAGSVMGSPQYLSPEQIRGDELDGRTDMFSLGVVVYELLSGKRPFEGETITTLVYQILHKEPPSVSALRFIPTRLEQLLDKLLAKDRDERSATGALVAAELAAIERDLDDETLSAPAAAVGMTVTHLLPRRTGSGDVPSSQVRPVPTADQRSAVPPPPPPLPPVPAAATPVDITTHRSSPPVPPPIPPPAQAGHAGPAGTITGGMSPKRWIPLVAAVVLVVVLAAAAAGWLLFHDPEPAASQVAVSETPPSPEPALTSAPTPATRPFTEPTATPSSTPSIQATPVTPADTPRGRASIPQDRPREEPTASEPSRPPFVETRPVPSPAQPRVSVPAEVPDAPEAEPEDERPSRPAFVADRSVSSGLGLAFKVTPPDALILVDRTVIGTAKAWSGERGSRTYTLPGPGDYEIRIKRDGMRDFRIALEASETGGITPIYAKLSPLPAASVESGDLKAVRVSEGVWFRVRPAGATILVDGQPVGPASQFGGGLRGGLLKLPEGRHRISVVAPGHRQQDVMVEVMAGAIQKKEKIEVSLMTGAGD